GDKKRRCCLLSIRLTRMGAKKKPFYRIVVTEKRSKRDGRFVEILGQYDPHRKPFYVQLNRERVNYWIERGAQPTETVRSLIKSSAAEQAKAQPAEEAGSGLLTSDCCAPPPGRSANHVRPVLSRRYADEGRIDEGASRNHSYGAG